MTSLRVRGRLLGAAITCTLALVAVCAAAVASHVLIDVLGDFALPHDTYDGVGHASRLAVLVASLGFALLAALGLLWSACDATRIAMRLEPIVRIARNRQLFTIAVIVLSVLGVAAMESFDVLGDGERLTGVAAAFGGSIWLGLGVTVGVGLLAATLALRCARFIERARSLLVRALEAFISELSRSLASGDQYIVRQRPAHVQILGVRLGRAHKRGPPCCP